MSLLVTFKDEDLIDGVSVGPVSVVDDGVPLTTADQGLTCIPAGTTASAVEDLGWMARPDAEQLARDRGAVFTEV